MGSLPTACVCTYIELCRLIAFVSVSAPYCGRGETAQPTRARLRKRRVVVEDEGFKSSRSTKLEYLFKTYFSRENGMVNSFHRVLLVPHSFLLFCFCLALSLKEIELYPVLKFAKKHDGTANIFLSFMQPYCLVHSCSKFQGASCLRLN